MSEAFGCVNDAIRRAAKAPRLRRAHQRTAVRGSLDGGRGSKGGWRPSPPAKGSSMPRTAVLALALLAASAANAQGLDRDSLLTDAPAVPQKGTVRVTGGVTGTTDSSGVNNTQGQAQLLGSVQWTPVQNLAGDVGAYYQIGAQGPSARIRYQILNQLTHGLDLSGGVRFKTVGFHPDQGEVEFLVAAGRQFGKIELVLNGIFGLETGPGGGKDIEAKGFAGYRFSESVRAGLDGRVQAEVSDQQGAKPLTNARDYDLTAGPAVSWLVTRTFQLQALAGVAQPKKTSITAPVGVLTASLDF